VHYLFSFISDGLPEECLYLIFKRLDVYDLLSVQLVCRRFYSTVNTSHALWRNFVFPIPLRFDSTDLLKKVLTKERIRCLTHLALPEATQAISPTDIDNFFTSHLLKAVKLTYLDISGAKS
jgi:hypothetical protein